MNDSTTGGPAVPPPSPLRAWLMAARPKTLPAAIAPVAVGTALAAADHTFYPAPALAAALGALLLQIGVNLANDYFDYRKGVDTEDRLGPVRVTQSGLIPPARVRAAMLLCLGLAALVAAYFTMIGGWVMALVGAAAIASALAYSGGPYPLASHGLGDLFVFVFFGPVAVCGTYYLQALTVSAASIVCAVPVGLLITAILVVNNLRDIDTDAAVGKRTLAVLLGRDNTRRQYLLLVTGSYLVPVLMWSVGSSPWILLPLASIPMAYPLVRTVFTETGRVLNATLAKTARMTLLYCLLLAAGIMLSG